MADITPAQSTCPFCELSLKRLGNHLPHRKHRDGRDYQHLLSQKTLSKKNKSRKQPCPTCKKLFLRLDTHLRLSRSCQIHPSPGNDECFQQTSFLQPAVPSLSQHGSQTQTSSEAATLLPPLKLPQSEEEWLQSGRTLARSVVPAVLAAPTVDAKHEALCQGLYHHFSRQYGCIASRKPHRKRRHARRLKKLTAEKNKARKQFRHAKTSANDSHRVKELAQKFYRLVRLHSAEKRIQLKSKCRSEVQE